MPRAEGDHSTWRAGLGTEEGVSEEEAFVGCGITALSLPRGLAQPRGYKINVN